MEQSPTFENPKYDFESDKIVTFVLEPRRSSLEMYPTSEIRFYQKCYSGASR